MITKTVLTTLLFAVVIGCGAAAFALINGGGSSMGYALPFYHGDDHDEYDR